MTKLALVLARIRQLPPEQQEALAAEIEFALDSQIASGSLLTDEQWSDVESALADESEPTSTHEAVFARLRGQGAK